MRARACLKARAGAQTERRQGDKGGVKKGLGSSRSRGLVAVHWGFASAVSFPCPDTASAVQQSQSLGEGGPLLDVGDESRRQRSLSVSGCGHAADTGRWRNKPAIASLGPAYPVECIQRMTKIFQMPGWPVKDAVSAFSKSSRAEAREQ